MTDILGPADAVNSVVVRPPDGRTWASLDSWFRDCSSPTTDDGTDIQAAWLNGVTAALRAVWRANGGTVADPTVKIVAEVGSNDNGLALAIQNLIQRGLTNAAPDTGVADAMLVSLSPAPAELLDGLVVRTKIAATNQTPTPTLSVGTGGPKPVVNWSGQPLNPGDLPASGFADFRYDAAGGRWRTLTPKPGFGQSVAAWLAAGTYSWTCPAGVTRLKATVIGAGGGGGSVTRSTFSGGAGGGGGVAIGYYAVVPGTAYPITVGAAGAGQTSTGGGPGAAGGSSSFASFASASGGGGGNGQGASNMSGGGSGMGYGGAINFGKGRGSAGSVITYDVDNFPIGGGCGGGEGGGPNGTGSGNPGWPGTAPGAGGGGTGTSTIGSQGGNGAPGGVILEY